MIDTNTGAKPWKTALLCLLVSMLPACGWLDSAFRGSDNGPPPAELQAITADATIQASTQALWSAAVSSGSGDSAVALRLAHDQGQLFVAGYEGDVSALDPQTGQLRWQEKTGLELSAGVGISRDLVFIGSINGEVLALRQADGSEAWQAQLSSEIVTSPVSANGIVVVRAGDGTFTGLSALDGSILWTYQYTVPTLTLRGASRPILAQGLVIAGLDNGKLQLLALENGNLVGERRIAPPQGRTDLERMVDIDAEPRLLGNELYIATYQGNLTALNLQSGELLWTRDFSSYSGLEVDANQVYVVDDADTIWALDRRSGSGLWKQTELSHRRLSAPTLNGPYLVLSDFEGYVHWLDRASGRIVARQRASKERTEGAALSLAEQLYVLSRDGRVSAFSNQF